jgi:hypothetical protein
MKMRPTPTPSPEPRSVDFPDADELATLRAWYAGMPVRKAVERYLPQRIGAGQSARGVLGGVRRRLAKVARQVGRPDLAAVFEHADGERLREAKAVADAIEVLRHACPPTPQISDDIGLWLPARAVSVLRAHDIATLADLTVRIPRRRQWWKSVPGLGPASARRIEAFFAAHPALSERARPDSGLQSRRSRPVGVAPAATRGRWLVGCFSRASAHLHARRQQRLRSRAVLAVAARIPRDAASLP